MNAPSTPTPRTYWVVPHKLLAGAYPGAPTPAAHRARVEALWNAGVRTFINLMEPTETNNAGHPFTPYEDLVQELARASNERATCLRFPIRDLAVPTPNVMFEVLDAIDRSLRRAGNRVTYVHCFGGVGRTGTVVCSWLLLRGTATAASIFEDLKALRRGDREAGHRPAPETAVQREFVTSWAAGAAAEREMTSRIVGCLIGGAIGDAFGASIEFMKLAEIRARFGPEGLMEYAPAYGRSAGAITDDTQMTLFTAEGLLRAFVRGRERGMAHPPSVIHHAYLRWAHTQDLPLKAEVAHGTRWGDGWLMREDALWSRRAPGNTCLSALASAVKLGDLPRNDSKGCGTVMRVAPVGLMWDASDGHGKYPAFALGVEASKLTHMHATGYLAGGYLAHLIALLLAGRDLRGAVVDALEPLRDQSDADEVRQAVERAVELADAPGEPSAETVERLGGGWIAEEAVSIAIYCALVARDFEHGIRLAANISGDSDSTASITGQLLGVIGGEAVIPKRWRDELELHDVIERVGRDLALARADRFDAEAERDRYPGW